MADINKKFEEQDENLIRLYSDKYLSDPEAFEQEYGTDAVNSLLELSRRLNVQSFEKSTPEEEAATTAMTEILKDEANSPSPNQLSGSKVERIGKGGIRGLALLWNGIVDLGRGTIDPENWSIVGDKLRQLRGSVRSDPEQRNKLERYWESVKESAVRGDRGFKQSWMRAVIENDELDKYSRFLSEEQRAQALAMGEGLGEVKFNEIPFLDENLGLAGKAAEIAVQEIATMGPFAVIKLMRANKVAKWFGQRAGGEIKLGEMTQDGYKSGKVLSEADKNVNYENYLESLKGLSQKEAKKKQDLFKISQTKGKILDMKGGAYLEAEALTSAMVVAGGVGMTATFGEGSSIIGEVGGGIVGPKLATKGAMWAGDWMSYLRYRLPGNKEEKGFRALKALGYSAEEISTMNPEKKRKLIDMATARPGITPIGGFSSIEKKKLQAFKWMQREVDDLPDEMKDELMARVDFIQQLVKRFDDQAGGDGKLYTTVDKMLNMGWLASLRELNRSKQRFGTSMRTKFNVDEEVLKRREIETAQELNKLLTELSEKAYGNADFEALISSMSYQLKTHMDRLVDEKGTVGKQAREIQKQITNRIRTDHEQLIEYTNPGGYRYNWERGKLEKTQSKRIYNESTGQYEDAVAPDGTRLDETFDESDASQIAGTYVDGAQGQIDTILRNNDVVNIPVTDSAGNVVRYTMMPREEISAAETIEFANNSKQFIKEAFESDRTIGSSAYNNIDGYNIPSSKQGSAVSSEQMNTLTASLGTKLDNILESGPDVPVKIMVRIGDKSVDLRRYLANKRKDAILRRLEETDGEQLAQELSDLNRQLDNPLDESILFDDAGDLSRQGLSDFVEAIAESVDVKLPSSTFKLDISLQDLSTLRSGFFKQATRQINSETDRVAGHFNFKLANALTDELEKFDNLQEANRIYKEAVGDKWRQGIGLNLITRNKIPSDKLFEQFITPPKGSYVDAYTTFDRLFGSVTENGQKVYNKQAINLLQKAVEKYVADGKSIPEGFLRMFGPEHLGIDVTSKTDFGSIHRPFNDRKRVAGQQLDSVNKELAKDVDERAEQIKGDIELRKDYNPYGVPLTEINKIFRQALDGEGLRRAIISETYEGGDTRKVQAVAKLISEIPDAAQRKLASNTLKKTLYDGAIEAAYSSNRTSGVAFTPETVDTLADGTRVKVDAKLEETLVADSTAMQTYLSRNKKTLEILFKDEPEKLEDLKSLSALVTLVTGDITKQAIENFPTSLKTQSIMSRVYGVARGVISPKYVVTELLIMDARYRRGKLVQELATDPDAGDIMADVLLRNGLANKSIRDEFVSYFFGTMQRVATDRYDKGQLEKISDEQWSK